MANCEKWIKERITKLLIEMGIPVNLQGFGYFRECIYLAFNNQMLLKRVTKTLYPMVSEIYNVRPSSVERCMRHASEVAFCKTKFKSINYFYGMDGKECLNYKPTNSEIIALITEILKMEQELAG